MNIKAPFLTSHSRKRGNNKVVFADFPVFWDPKEAKVVNPISPCALELQNNLIVAI